MKKTIRDYDLKNKKVIIRVDFNVPIKDGVIQDDTRIQASLKTIKYAIKQNAKVILLSHLGKVKEEKDLEKNNLYPVSIRLGELLNQKVLFSKKTTGSELEQMINKMIPGSVLLVQNTRYEDLVDKKESTCNEELATYWASLGDIFINDAYGTCHRAHASNVGIARHIPNGIGFLVENEIQKLDEIMNENTHPFIVIMGGAKVEDKMQMIEKLGEKCDKLLIGGAMSYTFFKAQNIEVGNSLIDEKAIDFCKGMLKKYKDKITLPIDHIVSTENDDTQIRECKISNTLPEEQGFDIGQETIKLFIKQLENAKRVIINGPMGLFENPLYQKGTKSIYDYLTKNNIKTLVGGGDSAASINKLSDKNKFYHISTGGGATLEYLGGKSLPGIEVINEK